MTTPTPEPTPQAQLEAIMNDLYLGIADLKPALEAAGKVIDGIVDQVIGPEDKVTMLQPLPHAQAMMERNLLRREQRHRAEKIKRGVTVKKP